jgi:hypothetical protein
MNTSVDESCGQSRDQQLVGLAQKRNEKERSR